MSHELAVAPRLRDPLVRPLWRSHTIGQPCPDFEYGGLLLDGRGTYRLTGSLGELRLLLLQVHSSLLGHPQSEEIGNYDLHDFDIGTDGSFEVVLSASPHDGNWIRLDEASNRNFVLIRAIAGDWGDDFGALHVEAPGDVGGEDERGEPETSRRILTAADALRFMVERWVVGLYEMSIDRAGGKNRFASIGGKEISSVAGGSPSNTYAFAAYEIDPSEALIIELDPPESAYWSFQLGDVWARALDYVNHQTDVNACRAALDPDGKLRAVISLEDPGLANWLDPVGQPEGIVTMRNYRCRGDHGPPTMRRVSLSELRDHLPPDTVTVTPERRRKALQRRRAGLLPTGWP